jgi:hypothetical protein
MHKPTLTEAMHARVTSTEGNDRKCMHHSLSVHSGMLHSHPGNVKLSVKSGMLHSHRGNTSTSSPCECPHTGHRCRGGRSAMHLCPALGWLGGGLGCILHQLQCTTARASLPAAAFAQNMHCAETQLLASLKIEIEILTKAEPHYSSLQVVSACS